MRIPKYMNRVYTREHGLTHGPIHTYGTRSLLATNPHNTLCCYSYVYFHPYLSFSFFLQQTIIIPVQRTLRPFKESLHNKDMFSLFLTLQITIYFISYTLSYLLVLVCSLDVLGVVPIAALTCSIWVIFKAFELSFSRATSFIEMSGTGTLSP